MSLGIVNSLRTGNAVFDILIALSIPALLKFAVRIYECYKPMIDNYLKKSFYSGSSYVERELRHVETVTDGYWYSEKEVDNRNDLLQKAILLYLDKEWPRIYHNPKIRNAQIMLFEDEGETQCEESMKDQTVEATNSAGQQLRQYQLINRPQESRWVRIHKTLMLREDHDEDEGEHQQDGDNRRSPTVHKTTKTFTFRCTDIKNGHEVITDFVSSAYQWYIRRLEANSDDSRYMHVLIRKKDHVSREEGSNESKPQSQFHFKRYKLCDEKSFANLFFDEKTKLLTLLQHFLNKDGKYKVPGFPHKLGLLLSGPPGTGKTSLIKAIAQYTQRHIISIPLSRIKTNQQLMDIMFDQAHEVIGQDLKVRLPFAKCVFIFEDVDAACPIVLARKSGPQGKGKRAPLRGSILKALQVAGMTGLGHSPPCTTSTPSVSSPHGWRKGASEASTSDSDEADDVNDEAEGSEESLLSLLTMSGAGLGGGGKSSKRGKRGTGGLGGLMGLPEEEDKLDLAGVLNVLDGVVDTPGRLIILTSNHPEKLDPALIRPGRIDKQLHMGYMNTVNCRLIVEHYFQCPLSPVDTGRLENLFGRGGSWTPAKVEAMCANNDTIDELFSEMDSNHFVM